MANILTVKNWKKFQHYASKNGEKPVWIKFYLAVLDDYEFHSLPVECRALLPMLWLLASETNGVLKNYESIAFRLREDSVKVKKSINLLIEKGFLEHARLPLESFYTDSIPEDIEKKEEDIEKSRGEKEKKEAQAPLPDWMPIDAWNGFIEMRKKIRKPMTARAIKLTISKLDELKKSGNDPEMVLDQSTQRDWAGVFAVKENINGSTWSANVGSGNQKSNKHERVKAALHASGVDLGYLSE